MSPRPRAIAQRARHFAQSAPPLPEGTRPRVIYVRVSHSEHADLTLIAHRAHMSIASYIRWALLQRHGGALLPCDLARCPLNQGAPDAQ